MWWSNFLTKTINPLGSNAVVNGRRCKLELFIKILALDGFVSILAPKMAADAFPRPRLHPPAPESIGKSHNLEGRSTRMENDNDKKLREELAHLLHQHRVFDEAIATLELSLDRDQLQISRLKRQKLHLKDRISQIEDQLLPDIIA